MPDLFDTMEDQGPVIGGARTSDPETSHQAASGVRLSSANKRAILLAIGEGPGTDEAIYARLQAKGSQLTPSGYRGRRSEMVGMGMVMDSGERAATESGKDSIIWTLTRMGKNLLWQLKEGLHG